MHENWRDHKLGIKNIKKYHVPAALSSSFHWGVRTLGLQPLLRPARECDRRGCCGLRMCALLRLAALAGEMKYLNKVDPH